MFINSSYLMDATPIEEGFEYSTDLLSLVAKHTHGHSVGGINLFD